MLITYLKLEKIKMYDLALDITQYLSISYNDIMRILTKWSITSLIAYINSQVVDFPVSQLTPCVPILEETHRRITSDKTNYVKKEKKKQEKKEQKIKHARPSRPNNESAKDRKCMLRGNHHEPLCGEGGLEGAGGGGQI